MVFLLYILTLLWVVSVFSFARLRTAMTGRKLYFTGPERDIIFAAYLRISGIFILSVIIYFVGMR